LLRFLNILRDGEEAHKDWKKASVIPIYKKGDRKDCENYRGISLLNSRYKIYANIIKNKLSRYYGSILGEEKNGFHKGRSYIDGYFTMKMLL
jgi:sorting nexin-29